MNVRHATCFVLLLVANASLAFGENSGRIAFPPSAVIEDVVEGEGDGEFAPRVQIIRVPALQPVPAPAAPPPEPVPAEAQKLISAYDKDTADIRQKAEQEIAARQKKLIAELQKMQDAYTKPRSLEVAVAIRDRIRQLKAGVQGLGVDAKPDPGALSQFRAQIGKVLHFRVKGSTSGTVWGTAIYTDDSRLATAAVHAGVLREGQEGVVKVTMLPGQANYAASVQNGVSSFGYQNWPAGYLVEAP